MGKQFKYIVVRQRPYNRGDIFYQKNITGMDKEQRKEILDKIEDKYPMKYYSGAMITTKLEWPDIEKEPINTCEK
jgi:hypothetical protein